MFYCALLIVPMDLPREIPRQQDQSQHLLSTSLTLSLSLSLSLSSANEQWEPIPTPTLNLNLNLKLKLSPTQPKSKILCKNSSAFEENKQVSVDYDEGKHWKTLWNLRVFYHRNLEKRNREKKTQKTERELKLKNSSRIISLNIFHNAIQRSLSPIFIHFRGER